MKDKKTPLPISPAPNTKAGGHRAIFWTLGLLAFALYANTLSHQFALDDLLVVSENKYVQKGMAGLGDIFSHSFLNGYQDTRDASYRPLPLSMFAAERTLLGSGAFGHHLMNVLLYALLCALVYRLLCQVLVARYGTWLPAIAALLFAAHPLHTEVVANIKSRDELLAMLGIVSMLLAGWRYGQTGKTPAMFGAIAGYTLAVFSKESALPALVLLPLMLHYFTEKTSQEGTSVKRWKLLALLVLVAGLFLLLRQRAVHGSTLQMTPIDNALLLLDSPAERLASKFALISHAFQRMVWPSPLSADYSYHHLPLCSWNDVRAWLGLFLVLGLAIWAVMDMRKNRTAGGFGLWWLGTTYALTSNLFVIVGATLAERFLFAPTLGICLLAAWGAEVLKKKYKGALGNTGYVILAIWTLWGATKILKRNPDWRDNEHIFRSQAVITPNSARAQFYLGNWSYDQSQKAKEGPAKQEYLRQAVEHLHKCNSIYDAVAVYQFVYGQACRESGDFPAAVAALQKSVELDPSYAPAWRQLGLSCTRAEHWQAGLDACAKAELLDPGHLGNLQNAGVCCRQLGKFMEAVGYFEKVLQKEPKHAPALNQLVKIYRDDLKDVPKAMAYNERLKSKE